jgi:hypothetical protein
MHQVQVADESAHQPRLAHAGGERKAQRWKFALKLDDRRKLAPNRRERHLQVHALARRDLFRCWSWSWLRFWVVT